MLPRDGRVRAVTTSTRRVVLLLTVTVATLLACTGVVLAQADAPASPRPEGVIPDRYIVVLKDSEASERVASEQARRLGLEVDQTYRHALKGYAARIPAELLDDVRSDSRVAYVESDRVVRATAQVLPWGVNRIDADISSTQAGNGSRSVSNVNAYIIDTGIASHSDLNVVNHVNFTKGKNTDCHGHGTHVAGTVAARDNTSDVVGVAPGAPLTGVKVLNCRGFGTTSGVIKGVDWVTANAQEPAIANMSLGGGTSRALDDAVRRSAGSGIFYAVAAGNAGKNACKESPARAGAGTNNGIMTTAATNNSDNETSWSNYGSCVDIWAPGVGILSTKRGGGTKKLSGTSMASPHAGGTGALYLSTNAGSSPAAVESQLKTDSVNTGTKSKDGREIKLVYAGRY